MRKFNFFTFWEEVKGQSISLFCKKQLLYFLIKYPQDFETFHSGWLLHFPNKWSEPQLPCFSSTSGTFPTSHLSVKQHLTILWSIFFEFSNNEIWVSVLSISCLLTSSSSCFKLQMSHFCRNIQSITPCYTALTFNWGRQQMFPKNRWWSSNKRHYWLVLLSFMSISNLKTL